jgi:hypothetical protein
MKPKRVTVTKDSVTGVVRSITELVRKQVLIGIPEKTTDREREDVPINNATLGYIHENGSPAANIPARPWLVPGVQAAEEPAVAELKKASQATLRGDSKTAEKHLTAAGLIGELSAKDAIENGNFVPLKPATVRNRHRSRQTQSMRQSELHYLDLVKSGMSPGEAEDAAGIKPLINTAQMRNAVTHVVRKK